MSAHGGKPFFFFGFCFAEQITTVFVFVLRVYSNSSKWSFFYHIDKQQEQQKNTK